MAFKITIGNNKGGVAKSTTAVNLAAGLATLGKRTLLVDFDPSAGATAFLGFADKVLQDPPVFYTVTDLINGLPFRPARDVIPNLDLLPATERLAFVAEERMTNGSGHTLLAEALATVEGEYDFLLIDTQPTLSSLQVAALVAAPNLIVPVQTDVGNLPMAIGFHKKVRRLAETVQPALRILGVLPTFYSARAKMPGLLLGDLQREFGDGALFETTISRRQSIADAAEYGKPIILSRPTDEGAKEYASFTQEVMRRAEVIIS